MSPPTQLCLIQEAKVSTLFRLRTEHQRAEAFLRAYMELHGPEILLQCQLADSASWTK